MDIVGYISSNPSYFLVVFGSAFLVIRVFITIINEDKNRGNTDDSDEGDGGEPVDPDPKLDLPPGVSLPLKDEELVY
jgi:hypothetical protein